MFYLVLFELFLARSILKIKVNVVRIVTIETKLKARIAFASIIDKMIAS